MPQSKAIGENNSTPLHLAAQKGNARIVELYILLSKGVPIEAMGESNNTLLHLAAKQM